MDSIDFFIFVGVFLCGVICTYPIANALGKREAAESFACDQHKTYEPCRPVCRRRYKHVRNILDAEILLESEKSK